jgi:hypothetical protein
MNPRRCMLTPVRTALARLKPSTLRPGGEGEWYTTDSQRRCPLWGSKPEVLFNDHTPAFASRRTSQPATFRSEQVQQTEQAYSITSSARARKDSGIVRPIAFAAFTLTTSSNLVGC